MTPKVEVRNGEIWLCIGHTSTSESFGIIRQGEYQKLRDEVAANERLRMKFVLDHLEEFAAWIQWKGNPPEAGKLLEVNYPWSYPGANDA